MRYKFLKNISTPSGFNVNQGNILPGREGYKVRNNQKQKGVYFTKQGVEIFINNNLIGSAIIPIPGDIGVGTPTQGSPISPNSTSPTQGSPINPNSPFDGDFLNFDCE